jgi:hypothetical protein
VFGTIPRADAMIENGCLVTLYRTNDDEWLTYDELSDDVETEAASIPPETWRDGEFDAHDYIIEACQVGIYDSAEVVATRATRFVGNDTSFSEQELREDVYDAAVNKPEPEQACEWPNFEDWLDQAVSEGTYRKVEILEYRDADTDDFVAERVIVD